MRKIIPFLALGFFALLLVCDLMLSGCASRSTPSGGPKDTTAPRVDTSFPANGTLNFSGNSLTIEFSEYISLKNPGQQINFSPPLKEKPEFSLKGRELTISWEDSLRANTTYTISFGESIRDFTEGNVNSSLKFVFSTGSYIDSLRLAGRVIDARTEKGEKELLVALYDLADEAGDSTSFKEMPAYYTYTDEEGFFKLENLRYGNYHVIAFRDKRGNFRLNTGTEKMAFLGDTLVLNDSTAAIELRSFIPEETPRFFGARHVAYGQLELDFNYSPDSLTAHNLDLSDSTRPEFLTWQTSPDTSIYWFEQADMDSVVLLVTTSDLADTSVVYLRPYKKKPLEIKARNENTPFYADLEFELDRPMAEIDSNQILITGEKDTLIPDSMYTLGARSFAIAMRKRPKQVKVIFMEGALLGYDQSVNDSTALTVNTLRKNELGTVVFRVNTAYTGNLVLIIKNSKGEIVLRSGFKESTEINLKNEVPGIYSAEIIKDEDSNGQWSTGNYLQGIQPEKIIRYSENIEVRANWELELVWQVQIPD